MPKSAEKPFNWERKGAEMALALTFEGRWTHDEIAEKCAVAARTYEYWLKHPDFQTRLEALRADLAASLRDVAYADKAQRIVGLSQVAESARREYEQRPWLKEERQIGRDAESGEALMLTNEHFNKDAATTFREYLADIAAELGARKNVTEFAAALDVSVRFYLPEPEPAPDDDELTSYEESDPAASGH